MEGVQWPGRLEVISTQPLIILDGAHNPHAVAPLVATMKERYGQLDKQVLFTCIQTKAIEEMLELWSGLEKSQLTLTTFEDSRAYSVRDMQEIAHQKRPALSRMEGVFNPISRKKIATI